ncbi:MAG: hypothetical protein KBF42_02055 [Chitinophagales bacterium]|jgi:hypothetical protein|nr:hypothetical protein [Bacteroidota bacterium]MBK7569874.1 hypothetical protein [Bacteroidota bacterium]MBP8915484.1 hypothetical protein [Chitinophagales bacterium]MBP9220138.1 hypothetical protein [Chitinophagales bacterium]
MKTAVEDKLNRIADIWNYFILDFKFFSNKIKFNEDVKTNYFGDILGYFKDTLDIVFTNNKYSNYTDKFSFTISFLQAVYIQQDFIQEMLEIFKTGVDKGGLKKDPTYYINRELRNELVGHPIRKFEDNLISSTLFSYQEKEDEIQYLRYHKDNNFIFESKTYKIAEIQERHREFLEMNFDVILLKLKSILEEYLSELDKLENVIDKHDFKTVLKLVELYFEVIFKSDFIYDKASLSKIYYRRNEHIRYQNFIDKFYKDLRTAITEKRNSVKNIFEREVIDKISFDSLSIPKIEIVFTNSSDTEDFTKQRQETYNYEIGKIATKRNSKDFELFGGILKEKCKDNELVLGELEHMAKNISDEIEYYTSLSLICLELKVE